MNKLKIGDEVIVIAGKDKDKRGTVQKIRADQRVFVEGVNLVKKHQKPNPNAGVNGGIIEQEAPIHISNIMLYNPETEKGGRIGIRQTDDGKNERFFKSTNTAVGV